MAILSIGLTTEPFEYLLHKRVAMWTLAEEQRWGVLGIKVRVLEAEL
jgi:ASC-1-like (ASCH) protein